MLCLRILHSAWQLRLWRQSPGCVYGDKSGLKNRKIFAVWENVFTFVSDSGVRQVSVSGTGGATVLKSRRC